MIAYHYPPMRGGSGIHRTLKFSQYLPEFGWAPTVLTAHPRAYQNTGIDQTAEISGRVAVHPAFALDTAKHLSIAGRYPRILALPDRWISWWCGAVPAGLQLIRKCRPDVIWSTYPIATAHLIGLTLHRLTGIPWVADFRDPMTGVDYPTDRSTRCAYQWIEKQTIWQCVRAVCTTPATIEDYEKKFAAVPRSRFHLISNGYDEENFRAVEGAASAACANRRRPFVLLHSGAIYPSERDPRPLFHALSILSRQGTITAETLKVVLRAAGHETYLAGLIEHYRLGHIVSLAPLIPYREALAEILNADGLLILQAANCNRQIPAKLYEYLRASRPILALTDPSGDTARLLKRAGIDTVASLDSSQDIMHALTRFLSLAQSGAAPIMSLEHARLNSRRARTQELAHLLDEVSHAP